MAETEEKLQQAQDFIHRAEGFMSDAEFREDTEMKIVRYLQAATAALTGIFYQNQVIAAMLMQRGEDD